MEDIGGAVEKHPLLDDYWANKIAHVENISVPMYVVASYSTGLHSRGSFDAFIKGKTSEKWLRVHAAQECESAVTSRYNHVLATDFSSRV